MDTQQDASAQISIESNDSQNVINDLTQVAETFDALESDGVDITPLSEEEYTKQAQLKEFEDRMAKYLSSKANHQPGKEFILSDTVYEVRDLPHRGSWVRKEPIQVYNPNMKNKSVRRKLLKNPSKYTVINN